MDSFEYSEYVLAPPPSPLASDFGDAIGEGNRSRFSSELDFPRNNLFLGSSSEDLDLIGPGDNDSAGSSGGGLFASGLYRARSQSVVFSYGAFVDSNEDFGLLDSPLTSSSWSPEHTGEIVGASAAAVPLSVVFDPSSRVRRRRASMFAPLRRRASVREPESLQSIVVSKEAPAQLGTSATSSSPISASPAASSPDDSPYTMGSGRRHSVAVDGVEAFACPWDGCGKIFSRRYNLDTHMRVHTGEKPFICMYCEASFARNHDLRRHEKIHVPDREFCCTQCNKRFSRQDALKRHERSNSCAITIDLSDIPDLAAGRV